MGAGQLQSYLPLAVKGLRATKKYMGVKMFCTPPWYSVSAPVHRLLCMRAEPAGASRKNWWTNKQCSQRKRGEITRGPESRKHARREK